tara:strand:+ start:37 stop:1035 length:999 start_codon:yes stop_codon:yes gene_type:complete
MALVRAFRKEMGRSPNPGEMNMLKKKAKEMEQSDKIIPFPSGGKDKVNPFDDRPNVTSDADELKAKPDLDEVAKKMREIEATMDSDVKGGLGMLKETEAETIARMKKQNKEAVERLKKKKEKDLGERLKDLPDDIPDMAKGGIIGLSEGGPPDPSKRKFMKILGGLASIPILGRFVTPVKQVAEVAPAAVEAVKGVPSYFFKLADKIRRLGDDAPGLTSVERESGKKFKNYDMVENTDGEIVIKKNTEGGGMFGNEYETGIVQEEVMVYKPKKRTEDGILNEDYQEITVKPDYEGKMKEVEDGLETVEDIMKEVGEKRIKQAGGGIAYLLGE